MIDLFKPVSRAAAALAMVMALALTGCGGGGGGSNAPAAAPPPAATLPVITAQPTDRSAVAGSIASFSVTATNATGYQWQRSSAAAAGATFADVTGATAASHTTAATTPADSGAQYRVVVSGAGGNVTSSAATLTVTAVAVAPAITVQPASVTITAGQNASFSVTATGTALGYQWQLSTDSGASYDDVAGATAATFTLNAVSVAEDGYFLRVMVSNSLGSVTSARVMLLVNPAPVAAAITQQPANQSVVAPASATFSVLAVGDPAPTLQWQLSTNNGAFTDIANATASSYTTPATVTGDSGKQYRVIATNAAGASTSAVATLTVNPAPVAPAFTTQPANVTITAGQSTQFTVAASGTPTPTLQWQLSTDNGVTWNNITGATGTVFNVINAAQGNNGRQFRAGASNGVGPAVNSNAAVLTVLPAAGVGRFAYVANEADNTISIYTVNAASGQLRHRGYAQTGTGPKSVAVDSSGKFAYVVNAASNNVSAYAIDAATGSLSPVAGSPFATGVAPQAVTVDPKGRFAYVTNMAVGSGGSVSAFTIDAATGALAAVAGSPFAAGVNPYSVAADPSGKFLYVANGGGSVSAYAIQSATGALTAVAGSPFAAGNGTYFVTVDPSGRFVYAANGGGGTISAFTIDLASGALTSAGSTRLAATGLRNLAIDPLGKFIYAANLAGNVFAYAIHSVTGALTAVAGSPFSAGASSGSVVVDPSGSFAYVGNQGSNDVSTYRIDAATGALTALARVASRVGPSAIAMTRGTAAVTYTPKAAYTANYSNGNTSSSFRIDAATGALTRLADTAAFGMPTSIAVHPTGRFAYTTHEVIVESPGQTNLSAYTVGGTNGELTLVNAQAGGSPPVAIAVEPSGRFAFVAISADAVTVNGIDATTGVFTYISTSFLSQGSIPSAITADPSGRFVYIANSYFNNLGSGTISGYLVNAATGLLTEIDLNGGGAGVQLTTGPNPSSITVHPSGRFVYITHLNGVNSYLIDSASGLLINAATVLADAPAADPRSIAVDPSGRFAYVANRGTGSVTHYRIDPVDGQLTRIGAVATHSLPSAVTVEASGQFAYVANAGSNTVSSYRIAADTGALTLIGSVASGVAPVAIATSGSMQ